MARVDYRGSQPASRVKVLGDGTLEDDVAGQSDGQTAGTITVGWGGMVRRARARSRTARHLDSARACARSSSWRTPGSRIGRRVAA